MKTTSCPAKCIYCGQNDATPEFSDLGCGCPETPDYMRADAAPVKPQRRCIGCGEFASACCCGHRHAHH